MPTPELILASTSVYRRALLERLRLPFRCVAPMVDETAASSGLTEPRAIAAELARRKARAVAARFPEAVVIGSDQLCAVDRTILGKPETPARAEQQLASLAGRVHRLLTAVAVVWRDVLLEDGVESIDEFLDETTLTMRPLGRSEIARYVAAEQPLDCAGSYKIEGLGITLFERIETHDATAIIGLPLLALGAVLRKCGFELP